MTSDKKGDLIPFIKDKETRDIVRRQFSATSIGNPASTKSKALKEQLERINRTMDELSKMTQAGTKYLEDNNLPPPGDYVPPEETLYNEAAYRKKKDDAKKRREKNNEKVTRDYRLTNKYTDPSWDK